MLGAGTASQAAPVPVAAVRADAGPALVVHVVGVVHRPGLYRFAGRSRVADAVARAGGATRHADLTLINLAAPLADGTQVVVPVKAPAGSAGSGGSGATAPAGPVHLNVATLEQLDSLPGVGPVTAQRFSTIARSTAPSARSRSWTPFPALGPLGSSSCATWRRREAPPGCSPAPAGGLPLRGAGRRQPRARRHAHGRPVGPRPGRGGWCSSVGVEAACARDRTRARRVVVGERAPRRARPKRSPPSGRDSGAGDRCRDRASSAFAVRRPRAGADAALRHGRDSRASVASTSTGSLASAGSDPRRDRRDPAASWTEGRLRRANVAAPSWRARRRAGGPLANRRLTRRPVGLRGPPARISVRRDGSGPARRAARSDRRNRARRGRGSLGRVARELPRFGALPPA